MKSVITLSVLSVAFLINSCSTASGPVSVYPINGRVQLEDSTGNPIPMPYAGITVTIPETNTAVTTDLRGNWSIANPPQYPNSYTIIVSKAGFGSLSFQDNSLTDSAGWWPPGYVVMSLAPDSIVHIENVFYYDSTSPWTPQEILPAVTSKAQRVFIFVDTIPNIPSTGIHLSDPTEIYGNDGNDWVANDPTDIGSFNFRHGQTIYISACAAPSELDWQYLGSKAVLRNVGPISNSYPVVIP